MSSQSDSPRPAFLENTGATGQLIAEFPWHRTGLGAIDTWPAHVRVSVALMLRSEVATVMLWGEPGVMVYNDAYAVFAGGRHPTLLGSNVREGWPEVAAFNDNVMRVGLAGGTLTYRDQELTLYRGEREDQAWMDLDYSPLVDGDGQPVGVMAIVVETTLRVRALTHIRHERERLSRMFSQAPGFMAMLRGPQHVFELANASYMRLVGDRAVLGLRVVEAIPEAAGQGFIKLLDQVYASGNAYTAQGLRFMVQEDPGSPPGERYVDLVYQPVRNLEGQVDGIFVEGVDVTAREHSNRRQGILAELGSRLERARTVSEVGFASAELLGRALGVARVGYGSIHAQDETLQVDRDWCRDGVESLAGVTPLRAYGSFIDSLKRNEFIAIADVRLDARTRDAAAALASRSTLAFVNVPVMERDALVAVFFVNDDRPRDWSEADLALIGEVGERTRTATLRLQQEAALRQANDLLESKIGERTRKLLEVEAQFRQAQKMEAIGQLTGGIAHDFNNLLAGIGGSLELLALRLSADRTEDAARYVGMAQESTRRAAALTQRLLAFSRRQTLDPKPVDVNRMIAGMEELVRRTVGPGVALEVAGADGLWPTRIDASQLENALLNLCINARDAMRPGGGRLTIATANQCLDDAAATDRDLAPGDYVALRVTDTGTGMTPEVIERAFDPFFTTKPIGEGTGLGLSMVYGFVRQSGGQLRIDSQVGKGTTMCLYLPRHIGELEGAEEVTATALASGAGETVLVIDDEPTIRMLVAEVLQDAGYAVLEAADGAAGLRILETGARIDLLVTDVGLPGGLNGRQVADAARVARTGLKVLFITGYAENAAVGNGLLAPGMEVITKPFSMSAMAAKVKELIERA